MGPMSRMGPMGPISPMSSMSPYGPCEPYEPYDPYGNIFRSLPGANDNAAVRGGGRYPGMDHPLGQPKIINLSIRI